jgi:hypothetical protein
MNFFDQFTVFEQLKVKVKSTDRQKVTVQDEK